MLHRVNRRDALILFAAGVAAAAAMRIAVPIDGLYGQDAYAYCRYAEGIWPWLLHGTPLPEFHWPVGYPLAVALFAPVFGGPAAGQIVGALSMGVAAAATGLLVRTLFAESPRSAAIIAGLAVVFSGAALRLAEVVMSDVFAMALIAAAALFLARSLAGGEPRPTMT